MWWNVLYIGGMSYIFILVQDSKKFSKIWYSIPKIVFFNLKILLIWNYQNKVISLIHSSLLQRTKYTRKAWKQRCEMLGLRSSNEWIDHGIYLEGIMAGGDISLVG